MIRKSKKEEIYVYVGLTRALSGKESTCQCRRCKRHGFNPWVEKIPRSRKWQPTSVFLPGEFHGQRSLEGYSPWGGKESDVIDHAGTCVWAHTHTQIHSKQNEPQAQSP